MPRRRKRRCTHKRLRQHQPGCTFSFADNVLQDCACPPVPCAECAVLRPATGRQPIRQGYGDSRYSGGGFYPGYWEDYDDRS